MLAKLYITMLILRNFFFVHHLLCWCIKVWVLCMRRNHQLRILQLHSFIAHWISTIFFEKYLLLSFIVKKRIGYSPKNSFQIKLQSNIHNVCFNFLLYSLFIKLCIFLSIINDHLVSTLWQEIKVGCIHHITCVRRNNRKMQLLSR